MTPEPLRLFGIAEASKLLNISDALLRKLVSNGTIPYRKVSNRIRFTTADLQSYIDAIATRAPAQDTQSEGRDIRSRCSSTEGSEQANSQHAA